MKTVKPAAMSSLSCFRIFAARAGAAAASGLLDLEPNDGTFACSFEPQCLFRSHGYVDANAGFAYHFPHGIEIDGRLNNFLNQSYEESFGFPALKLNFVAGMKLELPTRRDRSSP